jgi:hypothetical protein
MREWWEKSSVSPEQKRAIASENAVPATSLVSSRLVSVEGFSASRPCDRRSPILCKDLPILPLQATNRVSRVRDTSDSMEIESLNPGFVMGQRSKVDSVQIPNRTFSRQMSSSSPRQTQTFLPAWRRKSMNEIQNIKRRKEGICRSGCA